MKLKNCILLLLLAVITLSACKDNDNDKDILSAVNKEKISEALITNYPYDVIAVSKEYGAEDNAYDYYYYVSRSSVQLDNSFFVVKYGSKTIYYSYSKLESISITTSPRYELDINFNN